jgi:hypothetical protein
MEKSKRKFLLDIGSRSRARGLAGLNARLAALKGRLT